MNSSLPSPVLFTCEPGWETPLADELRRTAGGFGDLEVGFGRVAATLPPQLDSGDAPIVAFARQCLPNARPIAGDSIARQAAAAGELLLAESDASEPWRLHVFALPFADGSSGFRRSQLVGGQLLEQVKRRKRRLLKFLATDDEAPLAANETLVQLALASRGEAVFSASVARRQSQCCRLVSNFPGGHVEPAVDRRAPSRAFAKLVEVERRMNRAIARGETCVDLGSAPGSWAYTALARGARVTAVDRSRLREDLMRHARLTFHRGDAFKFRPEQSVDWLLSDVVAYPDRIAELLTHWLGSRLCRFFCVTIKFRGRDDYAKLETVKQVLRASGYEFNLRRLDANKNEATAFGRLPERL